MRSEFYQAEQFAQSLPTRIACCEHPADGIERLHRSEAIKRAHIAPNSAKLVWVLAFDIDRADAGAAWIDADLPSPNWTAQNPKNGHAHLGYVLETPVSRSLLSNPAPQRYLARIQHSMSGGLKADRSYAHFLTKTPGHARWRTIWGREKPYGLDELARALPEDMPLPRKIRASEAIGLGRNVTLFDNLRAWAYRARLQYSGFEAFSEACLARAEGLNAFTAPLPFSEVKSTARSVAKWTWAHITPTDFSKIQAARGKRSAARRQTNVSAQVAALIALQEGGL